MQAKAVAFNITPIRSGNPTLNICQSLFQELCSAGFSKQEIATDMQMSLRSVDRLLAGNTQQPSYKVLSRVLQMYCCYSLTGKLSERGVQ